MDYFGSKLLIKDKHLYWENGEPFFYLADTLWYGLTNRCTLQEFETILKDRKEKGFTAIQIVVGIPPEITPFDENAQSTNGYYAFNENFVVNKDYFEDIKAKVQLIVRYELVPVLFGSWGNYIDDVGVMGMKQLWNYIITYFSEYPVVYCLCGEVDIIKPPTQTPISHKLINKLPHLKKIGKALNKFTKAAQLKVRMEKWQEVANYVFKQNKEMHPLTVHIQSEHIASEVFQDTIFLSIDSFQSGHSMKGFDLMDKNFAKLQKLKRPYINLEPLYEGILEQFDTKLQTYALFKSIFGQAAGHSYGAHGLWQMSKGDNFMPHWGESQWNRSLHFKGSTSVGNIRKYISSNFKWQHCVVDTEQITILFKKEPALQPLFATSEKTILVYIPDPSELEIFEIKPKVTEYKVFNPITMELISQSSDLSLLKSLFKLKNELIIAINIV